MSSKPEQLHLNNNSHKVKAFVRKIFAVAVVAAYGFVIYQALMPTIKVDAEGNKYDNNCKVFLERAKSAGTAGIAKEELGKALRWLQKNYDQNSFEYRDLKGDMTYLEEQKPSSYIPNSIKESILKSSDLVNDTVDPNLVETLVRLIAAILLPFYVFILFVFSYALASMLGYKNEGIEKFLRIHEED